MILKQGMGRMNDSDVSWLLIIADYHAISRPMSAIEPSRKVGYAGETRKG